MILPTQGEASGFASDKERDTFGLHILAQIRYHGVMDNYVSWQEFEEVKQICTRLSAEIRGEYEAILDWKC